MSDLPIGNCAHRAGQTVCGEEERRYEPCGKKVYLSVIVLVCRVFLCCFLGVIKEAKMWSNRKVSGYVHVRATSLSNERSAKCVYPAGTAEVGA